MHQLSLEECQQEALKVLLCFDEICKEKKFKYFLIYGTLLGAIRHNGFIPWDDDLDVMMPREDFDEFVHFAKENAKQLLPFKLCDRANTKNYSYGIPRFANTDFKYVVESKFEKQFDLGTFIDIYPLDNFGDTEEEAVSLYKHCSFLNQLFSWYVSPSSPKGFFKTIARHVLHYFLRIVKGREYGENINAEIRNFVLTNTSDNNLYAGLVVWADKVVLYEKLKLDRLETIDHIFEGHMFPIPKCYDYMLTKSYGDYMQLPPKEERKAYHGYKIYKR